jgi:hypothetical protein
MKLEMLSALGKFIIEEGQEAREEYLIRSFLNCTLHKVLLELTSQGG